MNLEHIAQRSGRLSSFLRQEMGMSAGLVNRLKWQHKILVNGKPEHNDYAVQPGDVICALLHSEAPEYPAEDGPLTVLYEDAHILAVDKPAGMLVHPSHCQNSGTLANRVAFYYQKTGQSCAFHPLTRLDRDTFGVVLLAKNAHIHARISQLQAEGKVEKIYHALVFGSPASSQGCIDAPIARREKPSLLREIRPDGKPSLTQYTLLDSKDGISRLQLQPVTGRTHQLRLHCAYMGFPILGDSQYGSQASQALSQSMGYTHQQLCAVKITLPHPVSGETLCIESKMDASFL